jgi:4-amino-4-deoxy-L-arabinose transferase-like glycosyltransferase
MTFRPTSAFLLLILVAYGIVVGIFVLRHDVVARYGDPILYMEGAKELLHYDSAYHPPGYPAAIALVALVARDIFLAAKIVSFLSALAVLGLTWALGRLCFRSDGVAALASALVALSPAMVASGYVVGSDMLGAALFLGSVYYVARAPRGSWKVAALAGALAGLAYLTRYVYVAILPASLLYWIFVVPGARRKTYPRALLFVGFLLLVIAPWSGACIVRHGDLHNWNHVNIAFAVFGEGEGRGWLNFGSYREQYPTLLSLIASHPVSVAKHLARNAVSFPVHIIVKQCLLAGGLLLLGTFSAVRRPTVERMALLLNSVALLLLTLLAWLTTRFYIAIIPVALLFASHFILNCLGRSLSSYWPAEGGARILRRIPLRSTVVVLVVLVAAMTAAVRVPAQYRAHGIRDDKDAGEFLSDNTPDGAAIMTSSMNLAWYANRPRVSMNILRDVRAADLESVVNSTDANMVAFTARHSAKSHPLLTFLLDPSDARIPSSFQLLYHQKGKWPVAVYWIERIDD